MAPIASPKKERSWKPLETRYGQTQTQPQPQRKLLSLDGGGIRGVLTLEILLDMENKLRQRLGKGPEFRLAHYFDYIGGTSTGAIIAAGLARGMSAQQLLDFYTGQGKAMFDKAWLLKKVKYFYNDGPLAQALEATFGSGDISLASGDFLCLLLIVTMNRSTDSPWPISNNPFARYNDPNRPDCNTNIKLYQLVRASTAAPIYFRPETLVDLPQNLMYAMQVDQDINCRTTGRCTYGAEIDRELKTMIPTEPLDNDLGRHFLYARYNADISAKGLAALGLSNIDAGEVSEMDSVEHIDDLRRIGRAAAKAIDLAHFGPFVPEAK